MTQAVFELEIARVIRPHDLTWVEGEDAANDTGLGCSRDYLDLRATTWAEVREALKIERGFLKRREPALDGLGLQDVQDLDIGVAGATLALAAAGCIPFTSCNGGALGGHHQEAYPLVAFYLQEPAIEAAIAAASDANVGLLQCPSSGTGHAFACRLGDMHAFAVGLCARRRRFA